MEQWEYFPTYIAANARKREIREYLKERLPGLKRPKRFMVESVMPELNRLGEEGWELVHMEPVPHLGGKGDVLFGAAYRWSNVYFCVFKRRVSVPEVRPINDQGEPAFRKQDDEPDLLPVDPRPPMTSSQNSGN